MLACMAGQAAADIVCPDSSYCLVTFGQTYGGTWMPGQPRDYVTMSPNGAGETFAANGVDIRVYLRNCQGQALVGIPFQDVTIFSSNLCICPGGAVSDAGTDAQGIARFTGTLRAGGCVDILQVYADGIFICELRNRPSRSDPPGGTPTVKINSPDAGGATSPCFTDASDFALFLVRNGTGVGNPNYHVCQNFALEDGTIDASDFAFLNQFLAVGRCQ
jgi:hypothetical protein